MSTRRMATLLALTGAFSDPVCHDETHRRPDALNPRAAFGLSRVAPHALAFKDDPDDEPIDAVELKKKFTEAMDELRTVVGKRDEEIKELGEAREATGQKIADIDSKMGEMANQYAELLEKHSLLEDDHKELMKKAKRGNYGAQNELVRRGQSFVDSDAYKEMERKNFDGDSRRVKVPSFLKHDPRKHELKTITSDAASAGDLIDPVRVPGIFAEPERQFRLRDLMPVMTTNERTVEYVEETEFYQLYTELSSQASSGQADLVVDNSRGFYAGQTVVVADGTGNEETKIVSSIDHDNLTITLTTNLANTHAVDVSVTATSFVFTSETEIKPRANATFNLLSESMKTLAHWIPAARQILRNRSVLRQHIDMRLMVGLMLSEEQQILYGDDSTDQLQGLMTHASAQSYNWSNGESGDSKVDAIRRAITLAQLAHYPVDGAVLSPQDWEDIELLKGSDGHYIWVNVANGGQPRLWRAPLVVTTAIDATDFLVGAFGLGAALWDGEQASIRVSESHKDYFTRNMVALLAEQDMTQTIYRPQSFVVGEFDSAP